MVFPVVKYDYESWTIKKAECRRIDAFKLWCCKRLLRVPWTRGRLILRQSWVNLKGNQPWILTGRTDDDTETLVFWSSNVNSFLWSTQSKGFGIVNKAEVEVFLELSCFFNDTTDVGNLISRSFVFYKSSMNIQKFTVHVLLKPGLENFEHYFATMWDECNCVVVWAFCGIAFLSYWNENWPFPVLWPLLSFPDLLAFSVEHFQNIIFQDLK